MSGKRAPPASKASHLRAPRGKDFDDLPSSITSHLPFGGAELSLLKPFRRFFTVGVVVLLLGGAKAIVHYVGLEFLTSTVS